MIYEKLPRLLPGVKLWCKVCGCYLVTFLIQTPIYNCCVVG